MFPLLLLVQLGILSGSHPILIISHLESLTETNDQYSILLCRQKCVTVLETLLRSALFWDIMRRRVVIVYRRFGTRVRVGKLGLLTREDGTDTLSGNVGKQLPHDAV
jgi:hypothetical protein